ncbi:MAG TPA: hypothetical protein VMM79_13830 [Longimicrobiales bacterium]|nr:hypothetical protein [Longimicrobiales bacterium]
MVRLRKLTWKHIDLEIRVADGTHVRVVGRPGLWMPPQEQLRLVEELRSVVSETVDHGVLDYGVLTGDQERLDNGILTILYESETGRPVAFNAMMLMRLLIRGRPQDVLHLGLVVVDPAFRSRGLSWVLYGLSVLLLSFRKQLRPLWISNVTQVPAVVGMVTDSFTGVFPTARNARRSYDHLDIARQILRDHRHIFGVGPDAGFDFDRFIITNAYTGGSDNLKKSFAVAPKHRDEIHNEFCVTSLDYDRGDDFLQIGQFTFADARRYLLRSVPRGSLGSILYHALFLAAGSIALPLIHWFTPGVQMGDLRPWRS